MSSKGATQCHIPSSFWALKRWNNRCLSHSQGICKVSLTNVENLETWSIELFYHTRAQAVNIQRCSIIILHNGAMEGGRWRRREGSLANLVLSTFSPEINLQRGCKVFCSFTEHKFHSWARFFTPSASIFGFVRDRFWQMLATNFFKAFKISDDCIGCIWANIMMDGWTSGKTTIGPLPHIQRQTWDMHPLSPVLKTAILTFYEIWVS